VCVNAISNSGIRVPTAAEVANLTGKRTDVAHLGSSSKLSQCRYHCFLLCHVYFFDYKIKRFHHLRQTPDGKPQLKPSFFDAI
jgi:hypothetical protein